LAVIEDIFLPLPVGAIHKLWADVNPEEEIIKIMTLRRLF